MNINLIRLKPALRELTRIAAALERLADVSEHWLSATQGITIRPPVADTRGPEPEVMYTDEERDAIDEMRDWWQKEQDRTREQGEKADAEP